MPLVIFGNEDDGGVGSWDRIDWFRGHSLAKCSFVEANVEKSSLEVSHKFLTVILGILSSDVGKINEFPLSGFSSGGDRTKGLKKCKSVYLSCI